MGYIIFAVLVIDFLAALAGWISVTTALWIACGVIGAVILFGVALIGFLAWIATR